MTRVIPEKETWQPISEWGRDFQKYLDAEKAKSRVKVSRPKKLLVRSSRPRQRAPRNIVPTNKTCAHCPALLYSQNKCGMCQKCATKSRRQALTMGDRPTCKVCGSKLNRHNKTGLCNDHSAVLRQLAYRARKKAA